MFDKVADPFNMDCPSRHVLELVGSKWTILAVCAMQNGPVRTGGLRRAIGGISQKMLTQTLRDLEAHGLVIRESHPEVPPRVEYALTDLGRSLCVLLAQMEQWVVMNYAEIMAQSEVGSPTPKRVRRSSPKKGTANKAST